MEKIEKIRKILLGDLRSCYRGSGILASNVNYDDFWARDSFWALDGFQNRKNF